MKKRAIRMTAAMLSAGMTFSWAYSPVLAEESVTGTIAFAQCDDYINVRSEAGTDSDVTGKLYNNCAVTIVAQEGEWYEITSGNVTGYVKAEYFATGEEAEQIAAKVSYDVATVQAEALMVRSSPDESSDTVDMAVQADTLEVLEWDGDWMSVVTEDGTYGYVNAYYVDYSTYYPVGETLEEEETRLAKEAAAAEAAQETQEQSAGYAEDASDGTYTAGTGDTYTETADYTAETEYAYTEQADYASETEYAYTETDYAAETEYAYTEQADYASETEYAYTETDYAAETEYTYTETDYTAETEYTYTETDYTAETEYAYTEADYAAETEYTYTETDYVAETEYVETESTTSDLGQQIADYAVQFVGNPYVYGGTSLTNGADCSGFVQSVFANFGISLSRTAADQSCGGTAVDISSIQAGDLLFYSHGSGISHVALYIGGGQIVHASTEETGIIISNYDYNTPVCARRYWS